MKHRPTDSCDSIATHYARIRAACLPRAVTLLLLSFAWLGFSTQAHAQNDRTQSNFPNNQTERQQPDDNQPDDRTRGDGAGLTRELNLSEEQVNRIRRIRAESDAERRTLAQRMRLAQRNLDRAIYFEDADETIVEQRARELAEAQVAVARMRALTELKIRRVLTPEQLNAYRQLRQRFGERRQQRMNRRGGGNALDNGEGNGNNAPRQRRAPRLRGMRGGRNAPRPQ